MSDIVREDYSIKAGFVARTLIAIHSREAADT
jgi:hypothetical protein